MSRMSDTDYTDMFADNDDAFSFKMKFVQGLRKSLRIGVAR